MREFEYGKSVILVTGANGFIGKTLCAKLCEKKMLVRAVTRSVEYLYSNAEVISVGEIGPTTEWGGALVGVDAVVHLAGLAHVQPKPQLHNHSRYHDINALGTARIASQAAEKGVRRFVYLSTAKVCGDVTLNKPFDETDVTDSKEPYTASKLEAEKLLKNIAAKSRMEIVIIRPPLVYGPGVRANFHNMMCWLYRGIPLPLGSINNQRSFVAVDNLVDFICLCLNHPRAANQTFMVSDGEDISTTELLRFMTLALNVPDRLLSVPQGLLDWGTKAMGRADLSQRLSASFQLDISKARRLLGWRAPVSMEAALNRTAEYFLSSEKKHSDHKLRDKR
jgi:nucleoside-diphosphate-sugar epimerase